MHIKSYSTGTGASAQSKREGVAAGVGAGLLSEGDQRRRGLGVGGVMDHGGERGWHEQLWQMT
jgi:hypothetical protein